MAEETPQEQNTDQKGNVSPQEDQLSPKNETSQENVPAKTVVEVPQENIPSKAEVETSEETAGHLLESISEILAKLNIEKVYFIDDAINLDTNNVENFVGIVNAALGAGHLQNLQAIPIQNAINFQVEEAVLIEEIQQKWEGVTPKKKSGYFKHVYNILGQPDAIKDLNEASHLKEYFQGEMLECLTPNEWDEKVGAICDGINEGKRIMVLFDQDLKLAEGRFADDNIMGEDLISELKARNLSDKVIVTLFTHTITELNEELPKRKSICDSIHALENNDFFVLAKSRLSKEDLFADGIKKACLNTFCETIKLSTIAVIEQAQKNTIAKLNTFDTYDFDHTVFKSSFTEGVWEPETLLRITDVVFRDEVRRLMIEGDYVPNINSNICLAKEVSDIEIKIEQGNGSIPPYVEKYQLRHQELYESARFLNELRRPIDNGDIFQTTDEEGKIKYFILVAQECDLMVRSDGENEGKRGSETAMFIEIEILTENALLSDMTRTYKTQIDKKKFGNHYFADKYKLEYFAPGTDKNGIVHFKKAYTVDLNVLDLIVFNELGDAVLRLDDSAYDSNYHNFAWQARYNLIYEEFANTALELDELYASIGVLSEPHQEKLKIKLNREFSFIDKIGVSVNYNDRIFNFGIKRVSRLRLPKSKNLLDRYYLHLSRFAELHDFAKH